MLILITGLPGAGKSTFALALAAANGAVHLNTDRVRAKLGLRGHYDPESKQKVYSCLLDMLESHLLAGEDAIVDATLYQQEIRTPFIDLAVKYQTPFKWIEIRAEESVIRKRLENKRPFSEADFQVYLQLKKVYEPLQFPHLVLHSDNRPMSDLVTEALTYLETPTP
ncbi:MAG: ATP-binding protein [Saprospirales bacterium]|nr:ATP-binding protein [Saprospirales bacterium]